MPVRWNRTYNNPSGGTGHTVDRPVEPDLRGELVELEGGWIKRALLLADGSAITGGGQR